MKKFYAAMLLVATTALFGCGDNRESSPKTETGVFIDAAVQGITYESGGQTGITDGDGKFTYEIGKPVKFAIGGIILGEAPAKAVMTPIDLSATANADSTTPDVVARIQLLMSLSSTDPADGVITIPSDTHDAAKNMAINFATDNITIKIADLPKPWRKGVASEDEAIKHFSETLNDLKMVASSAKNQGDRCKQSKECSGSLVCRDTGKGGRRCVGRGEIGDDCAKEDAGHGSKSCGGNLKCRNTGGDSYHCVGAGGQGDLCTEADAYHGSESCDGNLICRNTGHKTYRCVGRGEQNDFCSEDDAGHGSRSCGGTLECRDTGNSNWHCIGRGQEGDLCSEEESGRGSWNCGGTLACASAGSDYICKVGSTNWMSKIADTTAISQLTIPGTHDSATYNYKKVVLKDWVVTQDDNLRKQLDSGIRFLDIRARLINDVLAIHHEKFFLNMFLGDVLDECRKFLDENPSEIIFMSIKKDHEDENSTLSFEQAFLNRYFNAPEYKELWYHGTISETFPKMMDDKVRGRIVLMSRTGLDYSLGIDFHIGDNKSGCIDIYNHGLKLYYEDLYDPKSSGDKFPAVINNLKSAQTYLKNKSNALWVTFTSANSPPYTTPRDYATSLGTGINEMLMRDEAELQGSSSPMGIVAMDFPSWELIRFMIDTNFKY